MRHKSDPVSALLCTSLAMVGLQAQAQSMASAKEQVIATERAFAKTMADRDQPGFAKFISAQAVFFSGEKPTRGKSKIVEGWLNYFKDPKAPFSWEPATVEVLDIGKSGVEFRTGAGPRRQTHRHLHLDMAARVAEYLAHRLRQGQRCVQSVVVMPGKAKGPPCGGPVDFWLGD